MASLSITAARAGASRLMGRQNDLFIALLVVAVIALMILPLSPLMLDSLIALNLSMSVILLMIALYVDSPLGLSTFPSLLLLTTLFRLSLNIASTRQILLHANAGDIIFTFGNLVVGGDIIVGVVVFLIIAIVQFIVVAKGAERVAEVAARFTLDAMPGKQMSIDADLRASIIDKEEARRRRSQLERESHLYGAMDGAMKFVKGDAIAALIIAAVNIVAGLAIGTMRRGMTMGDAMQAYSVLAIGDALVSQVPSLLVSISAGILVTRVADPARLHGTGLGAEIADQVRAHPKALLIGGGVILGLMLVPGFPKLQFLALAAGVLIAGYGLLPGRRRYRNPGDTPMPALCRAGSEQSHPWLDRTDPALTPPVVVQLFPGVERYLLPARLDREMRRARRHLEMDLGVPFPGVMMRPDADLRPGAYTICIHEIPIQHGELRLGHALAEQTLAHHLLHVMRRHAEEFIGIQEATLLLKRLAEHHPDLERELLRNVPVARLTEVLKRLVREEISIRNMREIAHALIEWAPREKDTVLLTEYVRTALSRYITYRFSGGDGCVCAVVLHPALEDRLRQALRQTPAGTVLMLDPSTSRQLAGEIKKVLAPHTEPEGGVQKPVVLTSLEIRPYLRKLAEVELGRVPVLSYQELQPTARIQPLASVAL